jgi:hypothetical protein
VVTALVTVQSVDVPVKICPVWHLKFEEGLADLCSSVVHKSEEWWIDMRFLLAPWEEDSVVDCKLFPPCNRGCSSVWNSAAWKYWEISAHEGCKRSCWFRLYLAMEVSQNLCNCQPAIITGVLCYEFLFWEDVTQIANSCPCTIHFDYFQ